MKRSPFLVALLLAVLCPCVFDAPSPVASVAHAARTEKQRHNARVARRKKWREKRRLERRLLYNEWRDARIDRRIQRIKQHLKSL